MDENFNFLKNVFHSDIEKEKSSSLNVDVFWKAAELKIWFLLSSREYCGYCACECQHYKRNRWKAVAENDVLFFNHLKLSLDFGVQNIYH